MEDGKRGNERSGQFHCGLSTMDHSAMQKDFREKAMLGGDGDRKDRSAESFIRANDIDRNKNVDSAPVVQHFRRKAVNILLCFR